MFGIGASELLIIGGVAVLLFGSKKIPDLAKGIASGIKEFKKELHSDDSKEKKEEETTKEQQNNTNKKS
jgi:TatA/E family protein of Tat protein translocase